MQCGRVGGRHFFPEEPYSRKIVGFFFCRIISFLYFCSHEEEIAFRDVYDATCFGGSWTDDESSKDDIAAEDVAEWRS